MSTVAMMKEVLMSRRDSVESPMTKVEVMMKRFRIRSSQSRRYMMRME